MNISQKGIDFISEFEGCYLRAYDDLQSKVILTKDTKIKGTLTIGIGHIEKVNGKPITWNTTITRSQAYEIFENDIASRVITLNSKLQKKVTQNMFDALLSYCYNCGFGNSHAVNCINYINKCEYENAALEIKNGARTSKGITLTGLVRRREAEYALFIDGMKSLTVATSQSANNKVNIIKSLQDALNTSYQTKLKLDGIRGNMTNAVLKKYYLKNRTANVYVRWVQSRLKAKGYYIKIDGIYGTDTEKIVKQFQGDKHLKKDGICGFYTTCKLI